MGQEGPQVQSGDAVIPGRNQGLDLRVLLHQDLGRVLGGGSRDGGEGGHALLVGYIRVVEPGHRQGVGLPVVVIRVHQVRGAPRDGEDHVAVHIRYLLYLIWKVVKQLSLHRQTQISLLPEPDGRVGVHAPAAEVLTHMHHMELIRIHFSVLHYFFLIKAIISIVNKKYIPFPTCYPN